jgi:hypothetical protein
VRRGAASSTPGGGRHVTPKRVLHSNFGCCIGTRRESETYEISGAAERRAVALGAGESNPGFVKLPRETDTASGLNSLSENPDFHSLHFL